MTEIPEDVMKAAYELQTARMAGVSFMSRQAAEVIARAILAAQEAQRERDAKIADSFEEEAAADEALIRAHGSGPPVSQIAARAFSRQIAAAIRKG